jgi:hypothetical protein
MTVLVNDGDAAHARRLVGKAPRKSAHSLAMLRFGIALALGALVVGLVAIAAAVAAR